MLAAITSAAAASGDPDPAFNVGTGPNAGVNAVALQPDGKILIGGTFTSFNGAAQTFVARLNADGSLDPTFRSPPIDQSGTITSMTLQPDGKLIVAGVVALNVSPYTELEVFRLNTDGSLDASFNTTIDANAYKIINCVALQSDGKIIIGGDFLMIDNTPASSVARLNADGSLDPSFSAGTGIDSGSVLALALQSDGKLLVGGTFQSFDGVNSAGFTRLNADGSVDPAAGSTGSNYHDTEAFAFAANGEFYLEEFGQFQLDTTELVADPAFKGPFTGGTVSTIASADRSKVYVGGDFTTYLTLSGSGSFVPFGRIGRLNADGSADKTFLTGTGTNSTVKAIAVQADSNVIVAGSFTMYNGLPANYITRLLGGNAPAITSGLTGKGQVGVSFSYQITTDTGDATSYMATGLPDGLSIDAATGAITGTPTAAGSATVALSATNPAGTGVATLKLTVVPALPLVTLAATTPDVTIGSGEIGEFTVSLSAAQTGDVLVNYTIKGTAINGTDYAMLTGVKKVKAGKTSKPIKIVPLGNLGGASVKAVKLALDPNPAYTVGTTGPVKVKIHAQ